MKAWTANGPTLTLEEAFRQRDAGERPTLLLYPHQGMGDHIICAGLYRTLAERWNVLLLVVDYYMEQVRELLKDQVDAGKILLLPMNDQMFMHTCCLNISNTAVLRLGLLIEGFNHHCFDSEFYRQAGVPFENRWTHFVSPAVPQTPIPPQPYTFVHDRGYVHIADAHGTGVSMTTIPGHRPEPNLSIFAYRDMLINAAEIHCANSAFGAFADSLPLNGQRLHFYVLGRERPTHKHKWVYH